MKRLAPAMSSRFRIDPNPPVAGRSLSVTYIGPADEVEYQIDDGTAVRIRPDENGRFLIDRVPTGDEIMFSDRLGVPGYLHSDIVEVH